MMEAKFFHTGLLYGDPIYNQSNKKTAFQPRALKIADYL